MVRTGFRTNLEPGVAARTAPNLTRSVQAVADAVASRGKRHVPSYPYPPELLTAARHRRGHVAEAFVDVIYNGSGANPLSVAVVREKLDRRAVDG